MFIKNRAFRVTASVLSDRGYSRPNNKDNFLLNGCWKEPALHCAGCYLPPQPGGQQLMAVFDGIGSYGAGELASAAAAQVFAEALENAADEKAVNLWVAAAFQKANNRILELRRLCWVCGTTGTVLYTDGTKYKLFHLGDSRAYRYQHGELLLLTRDHTLAQLKLDMGVLQSSIPDFTGDRRKLTRYVGQDSTKRHLLPQESPWYTAAPGDKVLLCTDGLYEMCPDEEIIQVLNKQGDVQAQTAALVQKARDYGGEDNITCALLAFLK